MVLAQVRKMRDSWSNRSKRHPDNKKETGKTSDNELNTIVKKAVKLLNDTKKTAKKAKEENFNIEEDDFELVNFSESDKEE